MKSAGTSCDDCHNPSKTIVSKAKESVCAGCHDASYTSMKTDWVKEIKTKSAKISSSLKTIKTDFTDEEKQKVQKAKNLISLIKTDRSGGIHNYMVLSSLLDKSIKDINEITIKEK